MFYYLSGTVAHIEPYLVVIDCGGVGYSLVTSQNSAAKLGGVDEIYMVGGAQAAL